MAQDQDWRGKLSFSERFEIIQSIVTTLKASDIETNNTSAVARAKESEKNIYDTASSKDEYAATCRDIIAAFPINEIDASSEQTSSLLTEPEISSSAAITIGTYESATHYRDGLFSVVYKARIAVPEGHETESTARDGDLVALKVTRLAEMAPPHNAQREARLLDLARHPNIITLIDSFQQPGARFVLVFPFMPYDLEGLMKTSRVSQQQAKTHLRDLFSALTFVHAAGIIHRDVKPSNILLKTPDGPAYLADFGIAWVVGDAASEPVDRKITDVGTTSYRPPELLFGNTHYGCSLDLWAAGCVVAEVTSLSNRTLFDSGELGSELALIQSIFKSLGTPNLAIWPEASQFRDWGKMQFHEYPSKPWPELLPRAPSSAQDLVAKLVRYESSTRLSADQALIHAYFNYSEDD